MNGDCKVNKHEYGKTNCGDTYTIGSLREYGETIDFLEGQEASERTVEIARASLENRRDPHLRTTSSARNGSM